MIVGVGSGLREVISRVITSPVRIEALVAERSQAHAVIALVIEEQIVHIDLFLLTEDSIHASLVVWIEKFLIRVVTLNSIKLDIVNASPTSLRLIHPFLHSSESDLSVGLYYL